jgi:hypothetical protein
MIPKSCRLFGQDHPDETSDQSEMAIQLNPLSLYVTLPRCQHMTFALNVRLKTSGISGIIS